MPIQVRIVLASESPDPGPRAPQRTMEIERITNTHVKRGYERKIDEINVYKVTLRNSPEGPVLDSSEFRHMYGDDLLSLVHEAIEALGGVGGPHSGMRR